MGQRVPESPHRHDSRVEGTQALTFEPIHVHLEAHTPLLCPRLLTAGDSAKIPSRAGYVSELFAPH